MRPLYFLLKMLLRVALWVYYPRYKAVNVSPKRYTSTIYMSNHSAAFMDPLVIAGPNKPIIFFMTRADIYKGIMKPIFWAAHMLPIYRQQDGGNTKERNEKIFKNTSKLLARGRNILIFAEGFTDDDFLRRLKPIKKGGVRMGFKALEEINWKQQIFIQAVGNNYSERNHLGGDCVVSYGEPLCLNTFKAEYLKNPDQVINDLTDRIEKEMQAQITHLENEEMGSFHENVMRITRKGMNAIDANKNIPLLKRWKYSQRLANWFNENKVENQPEMLQLKSRLEEYFKLQEKEEIEETPLYKLISNQRRKSLGILYLSLLFPFFVLGKILTHIPVTLIKSFVEKSFERVAFWGSVKMMVGSLAVGIYNFILIFILSKIFGFSFLIGIVFGILTIPVIFVMMRNWENRLHLYRQMNKIANGDYSHILFEREEIIKDIHRLIPVA